MIVTKVELAAELCEQLIERYLAEPTPRRFDRQQGDIRSTFSIVELPQNDALGCYLAAQLNHMLEVEVTHMRLHGWLPGDQSAEHIDNIHPGCATIIVRLDQNGDDRLTINGDRVTELGGSGYCLPEGTPHAILQGCTNRYTLTAWARPLAGDKAATERAIADNKLWCLYAAGPDEYHAMPDRETAERHAVAHNEWAKAHHTLDESPHKLPLAAWLVEVREWPFSANDLAEEWAETAADWEKTATAGE